ncbi:unnamed protein product [Zymoseptoria tritici ST99CH_1E4]|uniref:non-specific serine/threonine protein kinase n=1 Tax=Zymoseptoria tritici ST99CH_1E4 TaxID=1276532 RepID=A0A2H1GQ62_ZYMTR|nr:unnamed protein product [Zymoseptoria tritici ST99CH_1E4]
MNAKQCEVSRTQLVSSLYMESSGTRTQLSTADPIVLRSQLEVFRNPTGKNKITHHVHYVKGQNGRLETKIEAWEKVKELGEGGHGQVHLEHCVRDDGTAVQQAIKMIKRRPEYDWTQELRAIALFSMPKFNDFFVESFGWYELPSDDHIYISMEFFPHGDLGQYLDRSLPEHEGRMIISQMLRALEFMHERGFTHRDLKPANIMVANVGPEWWVKLADFGICKRTMTGGTELRSMAGTMHFIAPEILRLLYDDQKTPDAYTNSVDIWSIGVIAYLVLTKVIPFPAVGDLARYVRHEVAFPAERLRNASISESGCTFIKRCLSVIPSQRPEANEASKDFWIEPSNPSPGPVDVEGIAGDGRDPSVSSTTGPSVYNKENASLSGMPSKHLTAPSTFSAAWNTERSTGTIVPETLMSKSSGSGTPVLMDGHSGETASAAVVATDAIMSRQALNTLAKPGRTHVQGIVTLTGHKAPITSASHSSDGKAVTTASLDGTIKVWTAKTGRLHSTTKNGDRVRFCDVSRAPNGELQRLTIHEIDNRGLTMSLWEGYPGMTLLDNPGMASWVTATTAGLAILAPNGAFIVASSSKQGRVAANLHIIDTITRHELQRLEVVQPGSTPVFALSQSGTRLIALVNGHDSFKPIVRLWNTGDWAVRAEFRPSGNVTALATSPDGSLVALGLRSGNESYLQVWTVAYDDTPQAINLATMQPQKTWTASADVLHVALSSDGRHVAAAVHDHSIIIRSIRSGRIAARMTAHVLRSSIATFSFSPDGKWLRCVTAANDYAMWDLKYFEVVEGECTVSGTRAGKNVSAKGKYSGWVGRLFMLFKGDTLPRPPATAIDPTRADPIVLRTQLDVHFDASSDNTSGSITHHDEYIAAPGRKAERKRNTWRRVKELGHGSFGRVYLERCVEGAKREQLLAVKEVLKRSDNWTAELRAIGLFSVPKFSDFFVQSTGWYESQEHIYIAMEFMQYGDLQRCTSGASPLPEAEVQAIISQVLQALRFMHDRGFTHRDLKPANIMVASLGPAWWVKVADFGISKRAAGGVTELRTAIGTITFMAPELHGLIDGDISNKETGYTNAVDIWSTGVIAWLLITGKPPFPNVGSLARYAKDGKLHSLGVLDGLFISRTGQAFLKRCIAATPADRPHASDALDHSWLQHLDDASYRSTDARASGAEAGAVPFPTDEAGINDGGEDPAETMYSAYWESVELEASAPGTPLTASVPSHGHEYHRPPSPQRKGSCISIPDSTTWNEQASGGHDGVNLQNSSVSSSSIAAHHTGNNEPSTQGEPPEDILVAKQEFKVMRIKFSHDAGLLAASAASGSIIIKDSHSDGPCRIVHTGPSEDFAFRLNGKLVILVAHSNPQTHIVKEMDPTTWKGTTWMLGSEAPPPRLETASFSPRGSLFCYKSETNGTLQIRNTDSGDLVKDLGGQVRTPITPAQFTPNGGMLAIAQKTFVAVTIVVWKTSEWTMENLYPIAQKDCGDVAISANGKLIASCRENRWIDMWEHWNKRLKRTIDVHDVHLALFHEGLKFSPSGEWLAVLASGHAKNGNSGRLCIPMWSVETGQLVRMLGDALNLHENSSFQFSFDSAWLALGTTKGPVVLTLDEYDKSKALETAQLRSLKLDERECERSGQSREGPSTRTWVWKGITFGITNGD